MANKKGKGMSLLSDGRYLRKKLNKEERLALRSSVFLKEMKKKKEDGSLSSVWQDWKWILTYTKRYKGAVLFYILAGIASSTFSLVSAVASKYTIDIITGYQSEKLWIVVAVMVGSMIVSLVLSSVTNRISTRLSIDINNDIQSEIFEKIADASWMALNQYSNGDLLNRFNSDISSIAGNAINWLPNILVSLYQFVSTFCVIWYYSPVMACIALSSAPILLILSRFILKRQRALLKGVRKESSKLMAYESEAFYNMDTIKSFGIAPLYSRNLKRKLSEYKEALLDYNGYTIFTNVVLSVISSLVEFAAFGYCLWLLWNHQISYGTMTLFLQQRSSLSSAFNKVISIIPNILTASVSAGRIQELLALEKEQHANPMFSEILGQYAKKGLRVSLKNVSFAYRKGEDVLVRSDFEASPGEIVALVGPSGEGKTTMIRMILGLIHPDQGQASICSISEEMNSQEKREKQLDADTRALFSYVPQGNTILSGTIADNLRMVKEEASDAQIIEALKQACAFEFVERLPDGIHSSVGERGRGLSEGQAQRIAIARAILRDAPVLLLDEATSALDVATERRVLKNIIQSRPDKTIIVTTHRPSVLNLCQRVYRIMDGSLARLSEEESSRMAMDF